VAANRDYRAEARQLARAEEAQLVALLIGFDLIDKATEAVRAIIDPLRRPKAQDEEPRA